MSQRKASARRGRPLSPAEREWIAGHVGKLSVRQMAEQLQRPKSTVDRAARAIRAERGIPDPSLEDLPEPRCQDPPDSTEERLRELASFLRGATMAGDYELKLAELRNAFLHGRRDAAFIRLDVPLAQAAGADEAVADFVTRLYPLLLDYLPQ